MSDPFCCICVADFALYGLFRKSLTLCATTSLLDARTLHCLRNELTDAALAANLVVDAAGTCVKLSVVESVESQLF